MRRISFFLALCLLALPAFARPASLSPEAPLAVEGVIHLGTLDLATGQLTPPDKSLDKAEGDIIWDATNPSGFFRSQAVGDEVLDEGDLPDGTVIGGFQIGFVSDGTGSVTLRYSFYENNQFNTVGPVFQTFGGAPASYDITVSGLVGGGLFGYTLDVQVEDFVITGPDLDLDGNTDWGWGFTIVDPGDGTTIGPLITSPGPSAVGAPGAEDLFDLFNPPILPAGVYQTTLFFGGSPFAQFHMQLVEGAAPTVGIPTMSYTGLAALILLLGMAGLLLLYRR